MSLLTRTALLLAMLSILTTPVPAHAQSDAPTIEGDLPIESYLSLLSQVSPAAREGAEAYMAAFRKRCGVTWGVAGTSIEKIEPLPREDRTCTGWLSNWARR